jgi:hypothetical protein
MFAFESRMPGRSRRIWKPMVKVDLERRDFPMANIESR